MTTNLWQGIDSGTVGFGGGNCMKPPPSSSFSRYPSSPGLSLLSSTGLPLSPRLVLNETLHPHEVYNSISSKRHYCSQTNSSHSFHSTHASGTVSISTHPSSHCRHIYQVVLLFCVLAKRTECRTIRPLLLFAGTEEWFRQDLNRLIDC